MEAGYICQNLYLQAESLGLGCVAAGAFFDDKLNSLTGINEEEEGVLHVASHRTHITLMSGSGHFGAP